VSICWQWFVDLSCSSRCIDCSISSVKWCRSLLTAAFMHDHAAGLVVSAAAGWRMQRSMSSSGCFWRRPCSSRQHCTPAAARWVFLPPCSSGACETAQMHATHVLGAHLKLASTVKNPPAAHSMLCLASLLMHTALQRPGPKPSQPQLSGAPSGREQMKADRMKAAADARQAKELAKARAAQVGGGLCMRLSANRPCGDSSVYMCMLGVHRWLRWGVIGACTSGCMLIPPRHCKQRLRVH
jgi:hypothetical protein